MGLKEKLFKRRDEYEGQITDRGARYLIEHINEVETQVLAFLELGTYLLLEDALFEPNFMAEFNTDPQLVALHGKGKGHAYINRLFKC